MQSTEELIINWDQIGLKYVPISNYTFADKGSKRVGLDDKCQLTVLLSCTMKGKLLPTHKSSMLARHQLVCPKLIIQMIGI